MCVCRVQRVESKVRVGSDAKDMRRDFSGYTAQIQTQQITYVQLLLFTYYARIYPSCNLLEGAVSALLEWFPAINFFIKLFVRLWRLWHYFWEQKGRQCAIRERVMQYDYDLIVVGGGSGGMATAKASDVLQCAAMGLCLRWFGGKE